MTFMQKITTGIVGGWVFIILGAGLQNGVILSIGLISYFGTIVWGLIEVEK